MLSNRSPIYDTLLIAHVLVGMLGYGGVIFSGVFARKLLREGPSESTSRYFDGSRNTAVMFVGLVPVFGMLVLFVGQGNLHDVTKAWFDAAVLIWVVSGAAAFMKILPTERRLHSALSIGDASVGSLAKTIERTSALCSVLYVIAFYLMLFKP